MTLIADYEAAIQRGEITDDPLQREVLQSMQRLADDLAKPVSPSWLFWRKPQAVKGIYLYGSVGVGKTYLVDLFYASVAESKKARFHFHHFMQQIDRKLRQFQGKSDPLKCIAKDLAQSIRVLCFDEFLVNDVAYAMILAELLQALNEEGVILVVSSNTPPGDLYLNGVQRQRFLPAIALINRSCEVIELIEDRDYRLGRTHLLAAYIFPLRDETQFKMEQQFLHSGDLIAVNAAVCIQNRDIPFVKRTANAIWFEFAVLCNLPRSQLDYLELANQFDIIYLSNIPVLTEKHTAQTIMFVHFVDVMYDRGIKLIISAEVPANELYPQGELKETFKRTLSRLQEMQSSDYLNRHPRRKIEAL